MADGEGGGHRECSGCGQLCGAVAERERQGGKHAAAKGGGTHDDRAPCAAGLVGEASPAAIPTVAATASPRAAARIRELVCVPATISPVMTPSADVRPSKPAEDRLAEIIVA